MCSYKRIIILNMICKHVHRTRMLEEVLAVVFHLFAYQGENPKNFLLTVGIIVIKSRINMMMMTFFCQSTLCLQASVVLYPFI